MDVSANERQRHLHVFVALRHTFLDLRKLDVQETVGDHRITLRGVAIAYECIQVQLHDGSTTLLRTCQLAKRVYFALEETLTELRLEESELTFIGDISFLDGQRAIALTIQQFLLLALLVAHATSTGDRTTAKKQSDVCPLILPSIDYCSHIVRFF